MSCISAVMKARKPPTVVWSRALCQMAAVNTAASAHEASTCVSGVIVAAATTAFRPTCRSRSLTRAKREACCSPACCSRTLRHASTFSSTT